MCVCVCVCVCGGGREGRSVVISGVARMTELHGHCMGTRTCTLPKPGGYEAAENPHAAWNFF